MGLVCIAMSVLYRITFFFRALSMVGYVMTLCLVANMGALVCLGDYRASLSFLLALFTLTTSFFCSKYVALLRDESDRSTPDTITPIQLAVV